MILRCNCTVFLVLTLLSSVLLERGPFDTSLKNIANVSYAAEKPRSSSVSSTFSPRMDFEQWKPLTGRGDPLRNDPTYDYEPPVLERVHYWADETRLEREHYPERKSEVLMLGVSSRRPSVASRQPPLTPRRPHRPSLSVPPPIAPTKYEDFSYQLGEHYSMTILVPPPPPPPGHQPSPYILSNNKTPSQVKHTLPTDSTLIMRNTVRPPEHSTSLYSLQEANLVYQSSTTSQNWIVDFNHTKPLPVSSDYAGWGPTTPLEESDSVNDTHNLILNDHLETSKNPYTFYKPMLSEAPPPPPSTLNLMHMLTSLPTSHSTVLSPTITTESSTPAITQTNWLTESTTMETATNIQDYDTTDSKTTYVFQPTPIPTTSKPSQDLNIFDMLGPMMSMPLVNGPERPEDSLYAHASENLHIFKDKEIENTVKLETMQPPPIAQTTDSTTLSHNYPFHVNPHILNNLLHPMRTNLNTHDPYLSLRFTSPMPIITSPLNVQENIKSTTEAPAVPYLIIQGHSKVKTYGSKPKVSNDTSSNEILQPRETNQVKHLHPIKGKVKKYYEPDMNRKSRAQNLKSIIDNGFGSIEIQETDIGIKYDVSDGSEVPIEVYRKGIVHNEEYDYTRKKKDRKVKRIKRQMDIDDFLPFDADKIEEYVYDFLKQRRNDTGITGFIAQAITSDQASVVDALEDDDDDDNEER